MIYRTTKSLMLIFFGLSLFSCATAQKMEKKTADRFSIEADVLMEDLEFLSSDEMKGRRTGTPESRKAARYVVKRFEQSGITAFDGGYLDAFKFETKTNKKFEGENVLGFIKGRSKPESYIVVSAHFDHVGISRGEIYNGADDNASGTVALFAIAKYFKEHPPEHSLIFAAFDAEELGLEGAKHFVNNPPVPIKKILLNINLDMVSRSDKNELYIAGTYHYPEYKTILKPLVEKVPVKLLFGHDEPEQKRDDWTTQSDHGVFHEKKIPFLYFGVEDHADYHRPTDDFEKVDKKFFSDSVKSILMATDALDKNLDSKN